MRDDEKDYGPLLNPDDEQAGREFTRLGFREIQRRLLAALPEATPANEVIHPRREY